LLGRQEAVSYQENSHKHIGLTCSYSTQGDLWAPSHLAPGQALRHPHPLFTKLEDSIVAEELSRLGR
jgi:hypothetical protein